MKFFWPKTRNKFVKVGKSKKYDERNVCFFFKIPITLKTFFAENGTAENMPVAAGRLVNINFPNWILFLIQNIFVYTPSERKTLGKKPEKHDKKSCRVKTELLNFLSFSYFIRRVHSTFRRKIGVLQGDCSHAVWASTVEFELKCCFAF